MVSYPRGGFVTCGNILQLIDAAVVKIVGGDLEKVLIVTNHPDVYSLKYPNAVRPSEHLEGFPEIFRLIFVVDPYTGTSSASGPVSQSTKTQSVWIVRDHRTRHLYGDTLARVTRKTWGFFCYLPSIRYEAHISEVVCYDQPRAERYLSFATILANEIAMYKEDEGEMDFMPHLNYAKIAINHLVMRYATYENATEVQGHIGHGLALSRSMANTLFGYDPFGYDELLSNPDCIYSCGLAPRAELEKIPHGDAAVVVRTIRYMAYVRTVVG
ncbi:hypothetical protein [Lumpfish ranavirus]|uniref:Uncharacterized protein n=1 Tax=Lumpfish ranavirus TaxID=2501771 RepID=A0A3T0PN91_9VIRU|nr:hypothetical protein QKE36_gp60 [Lumpfish ranavirus]AZY88459.1 hypothetical protein [Lumpfish ranavirus]AZY88655.1 hypothetical protein [Lumpfish ranavirus]